MFYLFCVHVRLLCPSTPQRPHAVPPAVTAFDTGSLVSRAISMAVFLRENLRPTELGLGGSRRRSVSSGVGAAASSSLASGSTTGVTPFAGHSMHHMMIVLVGRRSSTLAPQDCDSSRVRD